MTDLEFKRVRQQGLNLGLFIFKTIKNHKNVGIFGQATNNDEAMRWAKSMFDRGKLFEINFHVVWDQNDTNISNYDVIIWLNFKFNQRLSEIKFRKTTSYAIGLNGFIPVVQIDYCFTNSKFVFERDCNYITDGISAARKKLGIHNEQISEELQRILDEDEKNRK